MNCPIPEANGVSVDGQDLGRGTCGVGKLWWNEELARWQCLADAGGALCIVEVKVQS